MSVTPEVAVSETPDMNASLAPENAAAFSRAASR
jgi:hypothetical protein